MGGADLRTRVRPVTGAVALVAVLVAGALVGCAGTDGSADEANPSATSASSSVSATTAASTTTAGSTTDAVAPQTPSTVPAPPSAAVVQPAQPTAGPGSSALAHTGLRESSGGAGADAWYVFEPMGPQPASARVTVVMHGYYEYAGYDTLEEFIRHTVLGGSIVVYPRWQTDLATPCAGPIDIEPCLASALAGIRGALDHLRADPDRVLPQLDAAAYFGFSFGGIITLDLANRWEALDLPEPKVIFLDDPHDGGIDGAGEPALDDSLAGIPATSLVQCHSGAEGVIAEAGKFGSSCNAVFPLLGHIADADKDLVLTVGDDHGEPALSSGHGVCAARRGEADAYDWNVCWKVWDGLRAVAFDGADGTAVLGGTPEHRGTGTWSDGTPIAPLRIQDSAPIRP